MNISELRQRIIGEMPPEWRFRAEDAQAIAKHKVFLLSMSDELVKGFYDTLFAHAPTKAIFHDGERPEREASLKQWWQKVVEGSNDDKFWDWITGVGLLHVKRKVKNNMMVAAWGYILNLVKSRAIGNLSKEEGEALIEALVRLSKTTEASISEGYMGVYLKVLQEGSGMSEQLMEQMVNVELERVAKAMKGGAQ